MNKQQINKNIGYFCKILYNSVNAFCSRGESMKKNKKKSLKKSIAYSLIIMFLFSCCSIISFHYFSEYNKKLTSEKKQYDKTYILLNELDSTINELDRLITIYISTKNPLALDEYDLLLKTYQGDLLRSRYQYILYPNEKVEFRVLLTKEIEQYNPSFKDEIEVILDQVDIMIIKQSDQASVSISAVGNYESLKSNVKEFIINVRNYHNDYVDTMDREILLFKTLFFTFITFIVVYGLYSMTKIYILVIKPIMLSHEILNKISNGDEKLRLSYEYNNEMYDLVNSLNKYIDISQNGFKLIEEQYNRLKLYSDIGEINYFEYSFDKKSIKIFYSKKFVDKYHINNHIMIYSVREYLQIVHPNDRDKVYGQLSSINRLEDKEYKLDFRLKYPNAEEYCFISTLGQIKADEELYFMGVQLDITYLKDIQYQLQIQEEQYRLIIENSTDLIAKINVDGTILYASKSYKDIFKGEKSNVAEFNSMLTITNNDWLKNVLNPPYTSKEVILLNTPQGEKWISWNNDAIMNENNEVDYIITVGHDITELKRMNDKLKYDSEHDMLTGLLNRRGLFNKLKQLSHVETLAAFFIDINKNEI